MANRKSTRSPVLRSSILGWSGRTACHASMAWPSSGSTGLVNAVPVLWAGTSSRQTASRARTWPQSPGSACRRAASGRSRPAGGRSHRCAARLNSHASVIARIISTGWTRPSAWGRSSGLQVEPGPQQLGPHVVGDHPRIGADQRRRLRGVPGRGPGRTCGDPLPFLQVAEERACHPQVARLGFG